MTERVLCACNCGRPFVQIAGRRRSGIRPDCQSRYYERRRTARRQRTASPHAPVPRRPPADISEAEIEARFQVAKARIRAGVAA